MSDREQPYDPYIPSGQPGAAGGAPAAGGASRTAALQAVSLSIRTGIMAHVELSNQSVLEADPRSHTLVVAAGLSSHKQRTDTTLASLANR